MKRLCIIPFLSVLLLCSSCGIQPDPTTVEWVLVREDSTPRTLQEIGILEAQELARLQIQVSGTVSEVMEDGTRVKAGDVVLRLDDEQLRNDLDELLTDLDQNREDLENEIAEYAVLTNSFQMSSQVKNAELAHARLKMETRIIPLTPEERRLREIEIELAELDVEDRISQMEREKELVRNNFAPATSLQKAQRELEAAETYLEEKRTQLKLDSLPLPEEERLTLETEVKNTEEAVRRNREKQNRDLKIQQLKIEGQKLMLDHKHEKIAQLEEQLEEVVLHSPTEGILRLTHKWVWSIRGWMPIGVGERVGNLDIVGGVVDPNALSLRVIVHESDFPMIKPGQPVQARLIGFPDQVIHGEVKSLTELGQDRNDLSPIYRQAPAIHQALFLVQISLDKIDNQVMPGMTAVTEIEIEPSRSRLSVPREALRDREGQLWVLRRRNGTEQQVDVNGRDRGDGWFEITEGLQAGDEVKIVEVQP